MQGLPFLILQQTKLRLLKRAPMFGMVKNGKNLLAQCGYPVLVTQSTVLNKGYMVSILSIIYLLEQVNFS